MASAISIKLVMSFMISAKLCGGVSVLGEGAARGIIIITYFGHEHEHESVVFVICNL
jgi:hypothetical protein